MSKLNTYAVSLSYDDPSYTTIIVSAKSQDEAEDIVEGMTKNMRNVEIADVHDIKDAKVLDTYVKTQQQNKGKTN